MTENVHAAVETLIMLMLVVFAIAMFVQRVRLPYSIALVLAGLLGFQPGFRHIVLTPGLILEVFLPVLLFEGAYNVSTRQLWHSALPAVLLAGPGVLLSMGVTAAILYVVLGLPWAVALLFGALISPTDPIAVVSMFRELRVPHRLALLIEGESLFNDGTAITLFQIVLVAFMTGTFSLGSGILDFTVTVLGALAVGAVVGLAGSMLLRAVDNAQIQITATVLAAYGSYLLADHFTFSGAIAVVVAGLLIGNYGSTRGVSPASVHALSATWEFLGFVANSLIFLLIGIELDPVTLAQNWWPIAAAFVATVIARAGVVYLLLPCLRGAQKIPWPQYPAVIWGGLRGAVSLALMLSIPFALPDGRPFPERNVLQMLAFGVVGASLVLQGITMRPLIEHLGLMAAKREEGRAAAARARLLAVEGALQALAHAHDTGDVGGLQYERLRSAYELEYAQLERQAQQQEDGDDDGGGDSAP
jgi:monovalent cation:H+ antiporter, CPA1 family